MPDGRVEFEITADGRKAYASIDEVTKALKKAGTSWEKDAKSSTDQISGSFEGMVKKIVGTISAAAIGKMLLNIGKDAIQAASDLEEVQNVVDVTFGDAGAAKIEAWAKAAGEQFGLTETQAKKFTSTLGAMMKSAGMSGDEITQMSTDLSGLAADMASFYNLDFDTAFQKIRSGISGETEPLKQLGINMSEANLNAFALQQGLSKTFAQMSQGEKTILRYQYLMQATADAQGDFARTSNGFANATRMLETNIESLKTKLGEMLLPTINDVISGINTMLTALSGTKDRTVLDDFADIDLKTAEKIAAIESTAETARSLTGVLEEIGTNIGTNKTEAGKMLDNVPDGKSGKLQDLITNIKSIEEQAGKDKTAIGGIDDDAPDGSAISPFVEIIKGLGGFALETQAAIEGILSPTGEAADENALWLATCEELVKTLPGLSSIIDTQTGEIKGGTQAVYDYIDAWEEAQKGIVLQSAHEQKRGALEAKFAELPGLELDKTVAEYRVKKARDQLNGILEKYGIDKNADTIGNFLPNSAYATETLGLNKEQAEYLSKEIAYYTTLKANAREATEAYNTQKEAYDEAVAAYEEEGRVIQETYGDAIEAVDAWTDAQKANAQEALTNFEEATKAVTEYVEKVREATKEQVNSTLSGFKEVKTAAEQYKEAANAAKEFRDELEKSGKYTEAEINIKVNDKNAQITLNGMIQNLENQLAYIEEYQQNLAIARAAGISDEILKQLSDGSNESALYLNAIAEAAKMGDTAQIDQLNDMWLEVNKGKESFVDTLTQQKLEVDKEYDAMVAKAQEAAAALDVSGTASESTAKNITAMADAIKAHVPEVADQVDAVLAELNRLNGWGISIDFGTFGSVGIGLGDIPQHESGLNFVPFDGYLASLHEGEGILTAEENRIWQRFKNGQNGVDYDTLGGVMRDNVKPGGSVYLDGRVVGQVVSDMQGNQYRSLQRSGWQQ